MRKSTVKIFTWSYIVNGETVGSGWKAVPRDLDKAPKSMKKIFNHLKNQHPGGKLETGFTFWDRTSL